MRLCVLIPTYNESRAIGTLVSRVKRMGLDVVVIDDGSKDDTLKIANDMGAFTIAHPRNRGKGASLKSGFDYALKKNYDAVLVMDGDGQHSPDDIERFVDTAITTGADLVIGNRMKDLERMPLIRQVINRWMSNIISKISGHHIPDTQCGFRLIRSNILKKIRLITSKYETESEILIKAGRERFRISSVSIKSIYNDEVSTIHPLKDSLRFIRLILKMRTEKKRR